MASNAFDCSKSIYKMSARTSMTPIDHFDTFVKNDRDRLSVLLVKKIHFMALKKPLEFMTLVIGQSRFVPQVVYIHTAIQGEGHW